LKEMTIGLGQQEGLQGPHGLHGSGQNRGGGGQQTGGQHAGLQGFTMTQHGGSGLQQGTGQQLALVLGEGGQEDRIGLTIMQGGGQEGSGQQNDGRLQDGGQQGIGHGGLQHGSRTGPQGGHKGIGQHLGGQH